ncbi:MAG: hypothetical protein ACE5JI_09330 [Acidobacteriota bacterium]
MILDVLYNTLKEKYDAVGKQQRSARVEIATAVMDVVLIIAPSAEAGPPYVPDRKLEEWA